MIPQTESAIKQDENDFLEWLITSRNLKVKSGKMSANARAHTCVCVCVWALLPWFFLGICCSLVSKGRRSRCRAPCLNHFHYPSYCSANVALWGTRGVPQDKLSCWSLHFRNKSGHSKSRLFQFCHYFYCMRGRGHLSLFAFSICWKGLIP